VVGDDELEQGTMTVKDLKGELEQQTLSIQGVVDLLSSYN
jgi:histidyl-tRNA synthetase